jgi:serine/threonine-protein kinase
MPEAEAAPAAAREKAETRAERAFREGRELLKQGNYDSACPKLEESHRLDPALGTLANLGVCYEEWGKLASASRIYHQLVLQARERRQPDREAFAVERIAALEPQLPRIVLDFEGPAPTAVSLDGEPLSSTVWSRPIVVDPGTHRVEVRSMHQGFWSREVDVRRSQSLRLVVSVLEPVNDQSSPAPPSVGKTADGAKASEGLPPARTAAVVLGGIGSAAAVVGSVFGILAYSTHASSDDECGPKGACTVEGRELRDKSFDQATASTISFGIAAASLAGAIGLWLSAPTKGQSRGVVRVRTTASTRHVEVGTRFEW